MSDKKVWFGPENHLTQIPAPHSDLDASSVGFSASGTYLNGGGYEIDSPYAHREYNFSWPSLTTEEAYGIAQFASGIYSNDVLYYLDPFSTTNVVTEWVSAPALAYGDPLAVPRGPDGTPCGQQTGLVDYTPDSVYGYPDQGVSYRLYDQNPGGRNYAYFGKVLVPPNYDLYFTMRSSTATGGTEVTGTLSDTDLDNTRYINSTSLSSNARVLGLEYQYEGQVEFNLRSIMATVVPHTNPASITTGGFVLGRGSSGLRFQGRPQITQYSAPEAVDVVGVSAKMIETGWWEQ